MSYVFLGASAPVSPAVKTQDALRKNRTLVSESLRRAGIGDKVVVRADGLLQLQNAGAAIDNMLKRVLNSSVPVMGAKGKPTGEMRPLVQLVESSPLTPQQKAQFKTAPFSLMMSIFDPVIDLLGGLLTDVLKKEGRVYDLSGLPFNMGPAGRAVDISLTQPFDEAFEPVSRRQLKSLRTINAFCVLYFKKWVELHAALVGAGLNFVFGSEAVVTVRTDRFDVNDPMNAKPVDVLPAGALGPFSARSVRDRVLVKGTPILEYVWVVTGGTAQKPTFSYYKRSARGLWDVRAEGIRFQMKVSGSSDAATEKAVAAYLGPRPGATLGSMYAVERGTMGNYTGVGDPLTAVIGFFSVDTLTALAGLPLALSITITVVVGLLGLSGVIAGVVLVQQNNEHAEELTRIDAQKELARIAAQKNKAPTQPALPPSQREPVFSPRAEDPTGTSPKTNSSVAGVFLGVAALAGVGLLLRRT